MPLNDEITIAIVVSHCNVMNGKPKIFFPNNSMLLMAFPKKNTFDSSKNLTACLPKLIFGGRFSVSSGPPGGEMAKVVNLISLLMTNPTTPLKLMKRPPKTSDSPKCIVGEDLLLFLALTGGETDKKW